MKNSALKQVADLPNLTSQELKERWRSLYGTEPPQYNREHLIKRLAHRIQELTYGGLSETAKQKMRELLEENGFDEMGGTGKKRPKANREMPVIGTCLIREWRGNRYEVTVVEGGFEFEGRRYRSLTAITKAITGTHWSGPAFFGLHSPGKKKGPKNIGKENR
jgi:hypothetical protein